MNINNYFVLLFKKYPCQDSSKVPQNEKHNENFEWDLTSRNENFEKSTHQFSFSNDDYKSKSADTFFDKLGKFFFFNL